MPIEYSIGVCPDCKTMIYIDIGRKVIYETTCPSCKKLVSLSPILHVAESIRETSPKPKPRKI